MYCVLVCIFVIYILYLYFPYCLFVHNSQVIGWAVWAASEMTYIVSSGALNATVLNQRPMPTHVCEVPS